jgi:two-component system sensor histidine kinase UhpB
MNESEERLWLFIATAPVAIAMFDKHVRYVAASKRWLELHFLPANVIGASHYDTFPAMPESWRESHRRALAGQVTRCEEDRWVRPDGEIAWARWEVRPWFGNSGQVGGIVVFVEDITERRQTELSLAKSTARFDAIISSAMDAVISVDATQRIVLFNPAAERMFGVAASEAMGKSIERFIPVEFRAAHSRHIQEFARNGLSTRQLGALGSVKGVRSNGDEFPIEASISQVEVGGSKLFTVILRDITERTRAEADLQSSREQLRALAARLQAVREEERSRLAREFHDVLAQDLTRLKLDIAWLDRRLAQSHDKKLLHEKLASMTELTDGAIGAVQRIATELRPVVLDSLGLAAAIEWQVKDFELHTGISCCIHLPGRELSFERARSTAVFRILQESLTNIVRHAQATEVEVELRCDAEQLILTVRDNGRGIRATELSDVQSMGLLGMRERATLLGGRCEIEALAGGGTSVQVHFPFGPLESEPVR